MNFFILEKFKILNNNFYNGLAFGGFTAGGVGLLGGADGVYGRSGIGMGAGFVAGGVCLLTLLCA
jgi:hypothetical protein